MATFSVPCPKTSALCGASQPSAKQHQQQQQCSVSFPSSSASLLTGSSLRFQGSRHNKYDVFKVSAVNEVIEKSSNSAPVPLSNSAPAPPFSNSAPAPETKSEELSKESASQNTVPDTASISAFMTQAGDLVKLVDSRDIMELQLKHPGCELIIRKKEALQQPASVVMMQPPSSQAMVPSQLPPVPVSAPASVGLVPSPPVSAPAPAAKPKSSHPPMKCPMAGTFYRSPAPGAPPFVKVGDKIQKGQVVCIIEAMKLMNEIEADQSGTIVEVLAEDAKPVSVDAPLFVIAP